MHRIISDIEDKFSELLNYSIDILYKEKMTHSDDDSDDEMWQSLPMSPRPFSSVSSFAREPSEEKSIELMKVHNDEKVEDESTVETTIIKNKSHSLKRSILKKFMPITFCLLLGFTLCTITFLYVSNRYIIDEMHTMLRDQYSRYGRYIAQGESAAVANVLSWTGLELEAGMTCDFYRSDYAIGNDLTYLGHPDHLAQPVINDPKFSSRLVSLSDSSYIFPNMSLEDLVHNLSPSQQANRDLVSKIDPIAKSIYSTRNDTLQTYFAMEEDGMFLIYPGQNMVTNGSVIDWRFRDWYQKGKERKGDVVITEPYIDHFTKKYVISLVQSVSSVETGNFKGVFGLDILLDSLQKYVSPEYKLSRELIFFVSTGHVLLDSDWFFSSVDSYNSSYQTLENPSFTQSEWNAIQSTKPGENNDIEMSQPFHCYAYRFDIPLHEFVFVACADEDTVLKESSELELVMTNDWVLGLALVISISCFLIASTLTVFYCTVSRLARDVDRSYKQINKLFHSLRMKAQESRENDLDLNRLSRNIEALASVDEDMVPSQRSSLKFDLTRNKPISKLFSPSDSFDANPFWNIKHPFLHHDNDQESRPPNTPPPVGFRTSCSLSDIDSSNSEGEFEVENSDSSDVSDVSSSSGSKYS